MKFYGKRRANYKKRPKSTKKRPTKRRGVSAAVKQYVSRSIKVASENKIVNWQYGGQLYPFNAAASAWYSNNFFQISPNISNLTVNQNTHQAGRIGNQIKTVNAVLKFILTPRPYNATTNPTQVPQMMRVVILSSKQTPVDIIPFTDFQNYMFQNGSSSVGPLSGILDMVSDFNKDLFTIYYDKKFKLGFAWNSLVQATPQGYNNNDYKMNIIQKINITKYLAKNYRFNDANSDPTSGKSLYVMFLQCNADGTGSSSIAIQSQIAMDVDYTYEE